MAQRALDDYLISLLWFFKILRRHNCNCSLAHLTLGFRFVGLPFFSPAKHMHHPINHMKTPKGNTQSEAILFRFCISFLAFDYNPTWNKVF
jgi:hypothetical protein